jgi:tetratricopeptide (TPR) repeat protein
VYKCLLFVGLLATASADDSTLALSLRAQTDFDRVASAALPNVPDTLRCAQTQAEMVMVARPPEVPLVHFRKGYCEILDAAVTSSRAEYSQAAADFAQALGAGSARGNEPVSSGLQVLSAIARLQSGASPAVLPAIKAELEQAVTSPSCPISFMSVRLCQELIDTGRLWEGWLALREDDLGAAGRHFQFYPDLGWSAWVAGRQAYDSRRYPAAVEAFDKAVGNWTDARKYSLPGLVHILGPQPDLPGALVKLGSAQYLAGRYQVALATLDGVAKSHPENAWAIFVRGLARDALGQADAAMADYQLASRSAFADPGLPFASGQAHFYRGVWLFRRRSYAQAEDEFSSSLNFGPGPALRDDVPAWRQMAAVAGGSCEVAAGKLREALPGVSDFFPRREAEGLLAGCGAPPATITSTSDAIRPSM